MKVWYLLGCLKCLGTNVSQIMEVTSKVYWLAVWIIINCAHSKCNTHLLYIFMFNSEDLYSCIFTHREEGVNLQFELMIPRSLIYFQQILFRKHTSLKHLSSSPPPLPYTSHTPCSVLNLHDISQSPIYQARKTYQIPVRLCFTEYQQITRENIEMNKLTKIINRPQCVLH